MRELGRKLYNVLEDLNVIIDKLGKVEKQLQGIRGKIPDGDVMYLNVLDALVKLRYVDEELYKIYDSIVSLEAKFG